MCSSDLSNHAVAADITSTARNQQQQELTAILDEIRVITQSVRMHTLECKVVSEWKFAARVLDRVCFVGFTIFLITATSALLLAPKSYVY